MKHNQTVVKIEIDIDTFQSMRNAISDARGWMAHNAGGDNWSNRVRRQLNEAEYQCSQVIKENIAF